MMVPAPKSHTATVASVLHDLVHPMKGLFNMTRSVFGIVAAGVVLLTMANSTSGGSIMVYSDGATGTASVTGTASGAMVQASTPGMTVNGTALNNASLAFNETITGFTAGNTTDLITAGTGTATITYNGQSVVLNFKVTGGEATSTGLLQVSGIVSSITYPAGITNGVFDGYNLSGLAGGSITDTINESGVNFAKGLGKAGATTSGSFTMADAAVPQPDSLVLLGLGVAGVGGYELYRRRRVAAKTQTATA